IATLVAIDKELDIALLKLPGSGYYPAKIGFGALQTGAAVTILGFPAEQELTITTGIIASTSGPNVHIVLSAPLSGGLSGSPIFSSSGDVIGIIQKQMVQEGIPVQTGEGLPIQFARPLLQIPGLR